MQRVANGPWLILLLSIGARFGSAAEPNAAALKDRWSRIGDADFELYTNAGDSVARGALQQLQRVRGFFLKASPLPLLEQFPVRIVVFQSPEQFAHYATADGQIAFYVASPKRDYIVMSDSPNQYQHAIHEYMHLIVRHSGLHLPTWLNEGWAEVYSTLRPVEDGVAVGDLIESRMRTLQLEKWLDIDTLTTVDQSSPIYRGTSQTVIFYAESWALAHMLFLAPDYTDNFPKFMIATHRGKSFAESCQIAFGKTSADVYADLKKYFERKKIYGRVFQAPLGKTATPPSVSQIDTFDARLMLTDLLAAIGRRADAKQEYEALQSMQPRRFETFESLGYLALLERNPAAARREFENAFAAGDADPQMCFQLAMLEREAGQPSDRSLPPLERAVQSKPDYTDALLQLGLQRIAAREYENGVGTLMKIDKIPPEKATPVFAALAYGYLQTGDLARARKDAETAKQYARTPGETSQIDAMLAMVEARAKSPFAPSPGEKLRRVRGVLSRVECSDKGNLLTLTVDGQPLTLALPDPKAVEFVHQGEGAFHVRCGNQQPLTVAVDYAPTSVLSQTTTGIVRRLEY